jgi:hypothetical protein
MVRSKVTLIEGGPEPDPSPTEEAKAKQKVACMTPIVTEF